MNSAVWTIMAVTQFHRPRGLWSTALQTDQPLLIVPQFLGQKVIEQMNHSH